MKTRSIFVMRHGERCDFLFGSTEEFNKMAFDEDGNYVRFDLNLPEKLISPNSDHSTFDTPLSILGREAAKMIGRAYKDKGIRIDHVFCSPSQRCVETAAGILEGLESDAKICVETGLYQWTLWCKGKFPCWTSPEGLAKAGLPVDPDYEECMPLHDLKLGEELVDYYKRSDKVVRALMQRFSGNMLLIGHGGTLEVCTRTISGGEPRPQEQFFKLLRHGGYLANLEMREEAGQVRLVGCPVLPLTGSIHPRFNGDAYLWNEEELEKRTTEKEQRQGH